MDEFGSMTRIWYPLLIVIPRMVHVILEKTFQNLWNPVNEAKATLPIGGLCLVLFVYRIVIPSVMICQSKNCKRFVLRKILYPLSICRNYQ